MRTLLSLNFARDALAAALVGGTIGTSIKIWRQDSKRAKRILGYAAVPGLSGLVVGYSVASIQGNNVYLYGLTLGGSLFILSTTFLVYREFMLAKFGPQQAVSELCASQPLESNLSGLIDKYPMSPMFASAVSGGLTGFLFSTIFLQGPKFLITNSLQGIGFGVLGQFIYNRYYAWKMRKVLEYNYPELMRNDSEEEKIPWSESLKGFLLRRFPSSYQEEEIGLLKYKLELLEEEEKRLLSELD